MTSGQLTSCLRYSAGCSTWAFRNCGMKHHSNLGGCRASRIILERAMKDWPEVTSELTALVRNLRSGTPEVMKAFASMAQAATSAKALDAKCKELIALGIAVAVRCDDCIGFHVKAACEQGASRDEVIEALAMAIYMGAGPSVMYASHALEAFGQFEKAGSKA